MATKLRSKDVFLENKTKDTALERVPLRRIRQNKLLFISSAETICTISAGSHMLTLRF